MNSNNLLPFISISLVLFAGALTLSAAIPTTPSVGDRIETPSEGEPLEELEARLDSEEFEVVLTETSRMIEEIESEGTKYDPGLIKPLLLQGDASRLMGNYVEAIQSYERAKHVSRLNFGLISLDQIKVVEREAKTYRELGQIARANSSYEYIFTIYTENYDAGSAELLPAVFALADWYVEIHNIFAARGMYEYANRIATRYLERTDPMTIRALEGFASTFRLERFRPPNVDEPINQPPPTLYVDENKPFKYRAEVNEFSVGEKTLIELVNIAEERTDATRESIATAKLNLADWFTLFQKSVEAMVIYDNILEMYQEDLNSPFIQKHFSELNALYFPLPVAAEAQPLNKPVSAIDAHINLLVDVSATGTVDNVEIISFEPENKFTKDYKEMMKRAIYRPLFVEGEAVVRTGVEVDHSYVYYIEKARSE